MRSGIIEALVLVSLCVPCMAAPWAVDLEESISQLPWAVTADVIQVALDDSCDFSMFREQYGPTAVPMFLIDSSNGVTIISTDDTQTPRTGQTLIALVDAIPAPA